MKKILVWFATIFFVASMVMVLTMVTGCKQPVQPGLEEKYGTIQGKALYGNENVSDHSGIQITLYSTNGLMAITECNSRGIATNGRAITSSCVTDAGGNYTFEDVPEGVYTIYASSNSSTKKAIATNVVVRAAETVTAEVLGLTATGSIYGKITVNGKTENVLGLDVFIAGTSYVAKVGSDGSYEISEIPAKVGYMLCVQKGEQTFSIDTNVEVKANESVEIDTYNVTYSSTGGTSNSFTWIGSFDTAPENPTLFSAYFNTTDGCVYIWDGTSWVMLAETKNYNRHPDKDTIRCKAVEDGIQFEIMFLEEVIGDSSMISITDLTDIENQVEMQIEILSVEDDYNHTRFIYPLVEAGKEYKFEVIVKNGNIILDKEKFTVKAIGGLGEYKVINSKDCTISFDKEKKVLSRTKQVFTNNSKVENLIIRNGTYYAITSVKETDTTIWANGNIWLAEFWTDLEDQDGDLTKINEYEGLEWNSFDRIDNILMGRKLGAEAQTRIKLAGYTYNDTACFRLNDYKETVFDWDDEEIRKIFVMYGFRDIDGKPYFFKDVPGVEKYYMVELENYRQYAFTKEETINAIEVYGKYIENGQTINAPAYIPKLPENIKDSYTSFKGDWLISYDFDNFESKDFPLKVSEELYKSFVFLEPEIQLLKATANFYDEDGTLIDSTIIKCYKDSYETIDFPSFPEKEGYIGQYWEDDYGIIYYEKIQINLTKPVINFTAVYREAEKRTAYFYDENGNQIAEPIVATESIYSSWWNKISLPSIPKKEGYITPEYWRDDYGITYYNGSYANLNYNTNYFYAVYTEIPTEPENMKFSIEDITYGLHSGSFYVTEGNSYTVTWADSYEGKEELEYLLYTYNGSIDMCDVKVSVYDEYGNTYFTEVDSGYNNPQTFTANTTGYVTINVEPYSGNSGYCAIQITEN